MGEKLKEVRTEAKLTQAELAEKLGVTQRDISRWETGKRVPSALMVKKMAQVLDCRMDDLV